MSPSTPQSKAFEDGYLKLAQAAIRVLEQVPAALKDSVPLHDPSVVALKELAATLDETLVVINNSRASNELS